MFHVTDAEKSMAGAIRDYLGADKILSFDESHFFVVEPNSNKVRLTLSWLSETLYNFKLSPDTFAESFHTFLAEVSKRITRGEIERLRREIDSLNGTITDLMVKMKDLERFKIAYELNKS